MYDVTYNESRIIYIFMNNGNFKRIDISYCYIVKMHSDILIGWHKFHIHSNVIFLYSKKLILNHSWLFFKNKLNEIFYTIIKITPNKLYVKLWSLMLLKYIKVMEKSVLLIDNCYNFPIVKVTGHLCKTNLPSNTAFRNIGVPQSFVVVESLMHDIASKCGLSQIKVSEQFKWKQSKNASFLLILIIYTTINCFRTPSHQCF